MSNQKPKILRDVDFDFRWVSKKVWALNMPTEEIPSARIPEIIDETATTT